MYGHLKIHAGPMFSGKTSALLKDFLWSQYSGDKVILIKPAFDSRWKIEEVRTHTGLSAPANYISDVRQVRIEDFDHFLFDEIQFFEEPLKFEGDIVFLIRRILSRGKNVTVSGLDMDWRGEPFRITGEILAMADEVFKLKATCNFSGLPASKTYKKKEYRNNAASSIELGASDIYEARNNKHWPT